MFNQDKFSFFNISQHKNPSRFSFKNKKNINILHLIPQLEQGGAESMLANLIEHAPKWQRHYVHAMISSENFFNIPEEIISMGTAQRGRPSLHIPREFMQTVHAIQPDIIHAWMYHANFISILGKIFCIPVIWSIHNDQLLPTTSKRMTRIINHICATLSYWAPQAIVYVSKSSRHAHEKLGYDRKKSIVIYNGIDIEYYSPKRITHKQLKASNMYRLALIGRYHPSKGHHFLIDVIARHPLRNNIELTFVGKGCATSESLRQHVKSVGLENRVQLMEAVPDVRTILQNLDIIILPSCEEGMPMVILEALAMGCIVCASRVGGIPEIGLPSDLVFSQYDYESCASSISAAIKLCNTQAIDEVRMRMRKLALKFDIRFAVEQYDALYKQILFSRKYV